MAQLLTQAEMQAPLHPTNTKPPLPPGSSAKPVNAKPMRMRFNDAEEIILLKEVVACKAHIAAFGSVQKKFELAAEAINANPNFSFQVKARAFREKFTKMVR